MTRPLIIAHRGATVYAPENSREAIRKAVDLGLDGIEVDLRQTKDGEFVCWHDDNTERITGHKKKISHLTRAELEELTLHTEDPEGGLPLTGHALFFDELLEITRSLPLLNIELKGSNWKVATLKERILGAIESKQMLDRVLFSSFYHLPLLRLQKLSSDIRTGFLIHPSQRLGKPGWSGKWLHLYSMHPPFKLVTDERIAAWREAGYAVYVWTVNDPATFERLTQAGVDAIITDKPEALGELNGSS